MEFWRKRSFLQFAQKARKIENCPVVCEVTEDGMLAKCLKEIEQLKKQLSEKKSNETQEDGDRQKLKALFAQVGKDACLIGRPAHFRNLYFEFGRCKVEQNEHMAYGF